MSLLNAWVGDAAALVAVDTLADAHGVGRLEISKLVTFPAQRLVLAVRGDLTLLNALLAYVHGTGATIDGLRDGIGAVADQLAHQIDVGREAATGVGFEEAEIVAVGWSEEAARPVGYAWVRMAGSTMFSRSDISPWRIGPNAGWKSAPPPPDCAEHMQAIAAAQVRFMRANHPAAPIGGRLLLAEITEQSISVRQIATFPDPA